MWLKQMVIDGFKSYAQRTVISDWDRHFTAITGLNGSGKSNILDAICFVLGITNLSQVRVENLQQLVYKEGQARVTKASVSLVFDNRDTAESPIGYEDYDEITVTRQVVIGGRNKYMINGQTAQLGRIRDLFHSVQLDVNNPHFLIMQGRITKVLNMKPAEILGMIQEAAGTKMYELKKSQAIKTMNKKQVKVNEINQILEEEITPQLEKLRREKTHYLQWTKNNNEIEKLDRLMIIYRFIAHRENVDNGNEELSELEHELSETRAQWEYLRDDIEKTKNEIAVKEAERARDEEGNVKRLSDELNTENKVIKTLEQKLKNEGDNIKRETKELKSYEKQLRNNENLMKNKQNEYKQCEEKYISVNEKYKYLQDRIDSLESQQLGISMDDEKRDTGSLAQQLMEAKRQKSQYKSQITTTKNKMKNYQKEINKLNKEIKKHDNNNKNLQKQYDAKKNKLDQLKEQQSQMNNGNDINDVNVDELQNEINNKREELYSIKNELQSLQRDASRFDFYYSDPYRNFDRNKVFGKLGKLFTINDNQYCKAIEICAGGRLYNVVVDSNETAKCILDKGRLKRRVTIIPLNKIASHTISHSIIEKAKKLVGEEHCKIALELVGYDDQLEAAMKYVFGSSFICTDMNSAKQVAFDKEIHTKAITLDGDLFNPSGLLTGGSSNNGPSILENIKLFQVKQNYYNNLIKEIDSMEHKVNECTKQHEMNQELNENIEILTHELSLLNDRINDSAYVGIQKRIDDITKLLNEQTSTMHEVERNLNLTETKCNDLQNDMKNYEQRKKDQVKLVKKEIADTKKKLTKMEKDLKVTTEDKNRIFQEMEDLKEEIETLKETINNIKNNLTEYNEKCEQIENEINDKKKSKKEIELKLREERKILISKDNELKKLHKIVAKNEKQYNNMDIQIASKQNELKKLNDKIVNSKKMINKMENEYDWLQQESQDMDNMYEQYKGDNHKSFEEITKRSTKLREEQSTLSNKINHKVMSMFERAENEYRDLKKKREIIRNDKRKIESVIRELDKKKEDTLESTYKKVNEHFGNIFSKLLPGTQCKLEKMQNDDDEDDQEASILDGLEVKVAFGCDKTQKPIWKESLSELSGGQRSLLALSLILSLLLFKPAPLYILDEIDAALDLSHTQNIGILISKYFTNSQFIVVSLKEGMFTNANVIFRTSFVDGVSAVKRTVGSGLRNNNKENERGSRNRNMR